MGLPAEKRRYTIAEYLEMEEKAVDRHEYDNGEILMMSGGTYKHSRINMNFGGALVAALKGKPCHPLDSNMRVRIVRENRYVYPDISIVCGAPDFDVDDPKQTTITNPRVVIEVLSESTAAYDRGKKFEAYRAIPSLEMYVLVAQDEPLVETFRRGEEGTWILRAFKGLDARVNLECVGVNIPLADLYTGITFEANA